MLDTQELGNFVKNFKSPSPFGCNCVFIKFDDKWGIKTYYYAKERDIAVERQACMAKLGFAPNVGTSFNVGEDKFCYMTQLAIPVVDCTERNNERWSIACQEAEAEYPKIRDDIKKLCNEMHNAGYDRAFWDTHLGNYGFIERKLVCIDFL